jgi:predicted small lipoprotein YifL
MRTVILETINSKTRGAGPYRARSAIGIAALIAFCTLLGACGQRGPLYYPVLPPVNAADSALPGPLPQMQNLPTPQTRLMNGAPMTNVAEPEVSLPQAGDSTMPILHQPVQAVTPPAGTTNGSALTPANAPQPADPSTPPVPVINSTSGSNSTPANAPASGAPQP